MKNNHTEKIAKKLTTAYGSIGALKVVNKALSNTKNEPVTATKAFGQIMDAHWVKLAKKVMKKSDGVKSTTKSVNSFLKFVDKTMGQYSKIAADDIEDYIEHLYKLSRKRFVADHNLKAVQKAELPEIDPSIWIAKDTEAVAAITRITNNSAGKFYQNSVQKTVQESVKKNLLDTPLTNAEAVEIMKKDLAKALKIKQGQLASKVVPKGFHGTSNQYFSGLAENSATLARTAQSIYAIEDVGAKWIVIRSVRSSRTCLGCLAMDGQKFKTARMVKHLEKILSIDDVSEYKDIQPSFHFKTKGESTTKQKAEAKKIASSDQVRIPPFHFRCECYADMG